MGRPLYTSILLARNAAEATQPEPPKPTTYPVVEKWSRWNAFDPDSDEFFAPENAVYEAFLTEEEIAERAQVQQRENARLLAERLLREAEADSSSASSSMTADSDRPAIGSERISASRPAAVQMEVDVETVTDEHRDEAEGAAHNSEHTSGTQEEGTREAPPPRRQPRRAPSVNWDMTFVGTPIGVPIEFPIPRISVVSADSRDGAQEPSRSPSPPPDPLILQYLSESPRPLVPVESPARPISPIPNTPARVSGVFATPPPANGSANTSTPSPAPTMTPRILSWSSRSGSDARGAWIPESPSPAQRAVSHYLGPRLPTTTLPLTY